MEETIRKDSPLTLTLMTAPDSLLHLG